MSAWQLELCYRNLNEGLKNNFNLKTKLFISKQMMNMKRIIVLLVACFCGFTAMAEFPINIGVHGGVSSNRIKVKDIPYNIKTRAHSGFMLGAFCRINLGTLYIEPSLNFNQKKSVIEAENLDSESTMKINSFDIPLMLGVKILDFSVLKLRGYLGPVASFPGKIKNLPSGFSDFNSKNTMWNGKIGVGVDVWKLTFDIDYEKSFQNLGHDFKAPRSYNFTLGFKII